MNNAKLEYVGNEAKRDKDTSCQSIQITLLKVLNAKLVKGIQMTYKSI